MSIKFPIGVGPIWVSIDETIDVDGRFIENIIIEKSNNNIFKPFLLIYEQLDKCTNKLSHDFLNNSMNILWLDVALHDIVLVFVSNSASYMVKADNALNDFFLIMIHLTCSAHVFHRIAETIRSVFIKVDVLISSVKNIFLKAPSCIEIFRNMYMPSSTINCYQNLVKCRLSLIPKLLRNQKC